MAAPRASCCRSSLLEDRDRADLLLADVNLNAITTDWHIQGVGDFNGDGKSDIVWRNDNGTTVLWEMNGGQKLAAVNLNSIPTDWTLQFHHFDIV